MTPRWRLAVTPMPKNWPIGLEKPQFDMGFRPPREAKGSENVGLQK